MKEWANDWSREREENWEREQEGTSERKKDEKNFKKIEKIIPKTNIFAVVGITMRTLLKILKITYLKEQCSVNEWDLLHTAHTCQYLSVSSSFIEYPRPSSSIHANSARAAVHCPASCLRGMLPPGHIAISLQLLVSTYRPASLFVSTVDL